MKMVSYFRSDRVMAYYFFLSVTLSIFNLISTQQLQLSEGENCGGGWVCSRVDNCDTLGDLRTSRPRICSFNGDKEPILCCPPTSLSYSSSKAATMCKNYATTCRTKHGSTLGKRKREARERRRIVGGSRVRARTYRHMALIGYGELDFVEWQCGGSIISNNFILSAAHCAENSLGVLASWARVGDLDISTDKDDASPIILGIIQRIVHPEYKPPAMYNDIALFRLEKDLYFNPWVGPACLATQPLFPQSNATATGWGRTDFAGDISSHLLAVQLPIMDTKECKKLLGNSRRIPAGINGESMICAGDRRGGKDTCSGDSGGPLVVNSTSSCLKIQVGIISFGRMCALPNSPGVYTRIHHYLPWIESIIWP